MENNNAIYINIIELANSLLDLSLKQIKNDYENYPVCLINYKVKEVKENHLKYDLTKRCLQLLVFFDPDGKCKSFFCFPTRLM